MMRDTSANLVSVLAFAASLFWILLLPGISRCQMRMGHSGWFSMGRSTIFANWCLYWNRPGIAFVLVQIARSSSMPMSNGARIALLISMACLLLLSGIVAPAPCLSHATGWV